MKKLRRILAMAGILLLLLMYALTMVFAVRKDEGAQGMFFASIAATIIVPVMIYAITFTAGVLKPKKSPVIDAIVFDLGRVLVDFPWDKHLESLHLSTEGDRFVREKIYESDTWLDLDRGVIDRAAAMRIFGDMAPELREDIEKYISTIYECLKPFPYTQEWLTSLREKGYGLYVLTNWPTGAREEMRQRGDLAFEPLLSGGIWSCEEHLLKPDPAIFNRLTERYHLDNARTLYIDDREENVLAARALGFAAFQFTSYPDAVRQMKSLGI